MTNFDVKPNEGMWDMMKNVTPEVMGKMISDMPKGFLESLNAKLVKNQEIGKKCANNAHFLRK